MPLLTKPPLEQRHEIFRVERILRPESDPPEKRRHKIIAVMPAYNAESTLAATLADMPAGSVDEIILVDDGSTDRTVSIARGHRISDVLSASLPRPHGLPVRASPWCRCDEVLAGFDDRSAGDDGVGRRYG